jgi:hypothetical protein
MKGEESSNRIEPFPPVSASLFMLLTCQRCHRSHFEVWFAFPKGREKRVSLLHKSVASK